MIFLQNIEKQIRRCKHHFGWKIVIIRETNLNAVPSYILIHWWCCWLVSYFPLVHLIRVAFVLCRLIQKALHSSGKCRHFRETAQFNSASVCVVYTAASCLVQGIGYRKEQEVANFFFWVGCCVYVLPTKTSAVQKFLMMSSHRDSHATHMKLTWVFNEFSCKLIWVSYDVFALMQLIWEIVGKKCMRFSWKTWGLHEKIFFILIFSYMRKIAKTHVLTVKKEFRIKKNKKFARNQDRTSNLCFTNPTC
jgi:hypothetical protein